MTVVYNTNFTHNPNSYLTLAVMDAARRLYGDDVVLADNRTLATLAATGRHDLLICLDGQRLHKGLLRRVRPCFPTMVLWLFEDPFMLDYNVQNATLFDRVYTNDPACVGAYGRKGRYLPLAASPALHHRPVQDDGALEYDIFFAGTMWPNRVDTIRTVIRAFPQARLKLVCPTNEYLPPLPSDLARHAIQWPISHESFIDFANASRVTLTLFRNYASHGTAGAATAPGPRLFELGLAGTAQVVELMPGMDPSTFGALGDIDIVADTDDLIGSIRHLLADPALRARRARSSQVDVAASQLYEHRLQSIVRDLGGPAPPAAPARRRNPRVLMCTHSTIHNADWGGVEVYQQTLAALLERDAEVFFWLRRNGQATLCDANGTVLERFSMPDVGWLDSLSDAAEEKAFSNVLGHYGFDVVHFQHLGHHTSSLPVIAKAAGAGTVFSVHDFYLVCSRYNLLDFQQNFCDIAHRSITACDICLRVSENVEPGAQAVRRSFMGEVIRSVDCFLFGTGHSERLVSAIYPDMLDRRRAVLGIPAPADRRPIGRVPRPVVDATGQARELVVVVPGNFLRAKGGDTVLNLIEIANPALYRFHLLGNAQAEYAEVLARWNKPNVTYHGRYQPAQGDVMAQADVTLHLSIWPETYCITLSEAWQNGAVPIVTDIGALADRVTHGVDGFKVRVGDASAVLDCLELLRADPDLLARMRNAITPELLTGHAAYAADLLSIYHAVMPARPFGINGLDLDLGQVHLLPHATWRDLAPPRHIFDASRRGALQLELPAAVQDWSDVQGSELNIDAICGVDINEPGDEPFVPTADLHVRGWTFTPGVQVGGQVLLALVGEDRVIFVPADRQDRADLARVFPDAPAQAGFSARTMLRGKWSEGSYRLALVNLFGNRAAFSATRFRIAIADALVTGITQAVPDNAEVSAGFHKVAACEPYRPLRLHRLKWSAPQGLTFHVDTLMWDDRPALTVACAPTDRVHLSGWAYQPGRTLAGHGFLVLIGAAAATCVAIPGARGLRPDVAHMFPDAPLCCGLEVEGALPHGIADADYAIGLVNVVDDHAMAQILPYRVRVTSGMIAGIAPCEIGATEAARCQAILQARPAAAPSIAKSRPVVAGGAGGTDLSPPSARTLPAPVRTRRRASALRDGAPLPT